MNKTYLKILKESILLELSSVPAAVRNDPEIKEMYRKIKYLKTRMSDQLSKIKGIRADIDLKSEQFNKLLKTSSESPAISRKHEPARRLLLDQMDALGNKMRKIQKGLYQIEDLISIKGKDAIVVASKTKKLI